MTKTALDVSLDSGVCCLACICRQFYSSNSGPCLQLALNIRQDVNIRVHRPFPEYYRSEFEHPCCCVSPYDYDAVARNA